MTRRPAEFPPVDDNFNTMVDVVTTRRCTNCDLCCTALEIFDLPGGKPMGAHCPNNIDCGCAIYKSRPQTCRAFYCTWRLSEFLNAGVPASFQPMLAGFVLHWDKGNAPFMTLFKDPKRPNEWVKRKRALEKLSRNTNVAIVIGGGKEATHYVTPMGRWVARADHPELFTDEQTGIPRSEFRGGKHG